MAGFGMVAANKLMNERLYTHFNEEMDWFEEEIKGFVSAYPDKSHLLEAIKEKNKDPHIERLFSGVAFLVAKLRQSLETNIESISDAVLEQHWPFIFQKYPAMMMVSADFFSDFKNITLEKGMPILKTAPLGDEKAICVFSTIAEEKVLPITLNEVVYAYEDCARQFCMVLDISYKMSGQEPDSLLVEKIKFHINAEKYEALALYGALMDWVESVAFCIGDEVLCYGDRSWITSGWCTENLLDGLNENNNLSEPRIILDFFAFVDKFLFFEIKNIPRIEAGDFKIKIYFNQPVLKSTKNQIDLSEKILINCFPVVNIFKESGEPFELLASKIQYPAIVDVQKPGSVFPVAIADVTKVFRDRSIPCQNLNGGVFLNSGADNVYAIHREPCKGNVDKLYFKFLNSGSDVPTVSYSAWVCNGNIPHLLIEPDMKFLVKEKNYALILKNKKRPIKITDLFAHKNSSLPLMAHLGVHFSTFSDVENLKKIILLYIPSDKKHLNYKRYVDCFKRVDLAHQDFFEKGVMKSRWDLKISVDLTEFINLGEYLLWFHILSRFFLYYAPINASFTVIFEEISSDNTWVFAYSAGLRVPL
jgi:type VI secretion system protein ImpG